MSRSNRLNAGRKTCATEPTSIFPPTHPHNQVSNSCDCICIDRSAARNNTLLANLKPVIPLSALTTIDDQHHAMAQRCCLPQVSSTSSHGPNFIHDYKHAPICSMGPLIDQRLFHPYVSNGNNAELNSVDGRFEVQHRGSHSIQQPEVIFEQYPKVKKSSIVSDSSADSIHPQGPLPPSPSDCDSSCNEEPSLYSMELTSRIRMAGEADTLVASSLGRDNGGYQTHKDSDNEKVINQ